MARRFRRKGDALVVTLESTELELLRQLPTQLSELLGDASAEGGAKDPVVQRLFPRAYLDPTEEAAEVEWQSLVHSDLVKERLAALELVTATLERAIERRGRFEVALTADETQAWLGVLNDARLALGTRLDLTEENDLESVSPDDPAASAYAIYGWLTYIQGELVEALLS
jgi:Domain of unknown function (DUF2017)